MVDGKERDSVFYIREKFEIGSMCDFHLHTVAKYVFIIIIALYMYGAMILKYVAGAKSLSEGISFTIFGHTNTMDEKLGFEFYYICLLIFFGLTMCFSLGNIENSQGLQKVTSLLRFVVTGLLILGSGISIVKNGASPLKKINLIDFDYIDVLFSNTIFIFIAHHSVSGIVYPVRP